MARQHGNRKNWKKKAAGRSTDDAVSGETNATRSNDRPRSESYGEQKEATSRTAATGIDMRTAEARSTLILDGRYVRLKRTNRRVIGLSLNRSQKRSALLSTTPRLRTRSSTNDLAPLRRMWLLSLRHAGAFVGARKEPSCCGLATERAEIGRRSYIVASRRKRR